ncbi:Predicted arabinose efflux permease, MFS family [Duganella sp. CF517]|nr:Predicted arabinose efflux permease, MFS family [Duganella sp. CF517]
MLWLVWLGANLTMWMNDVASAWLMTSLTGNAFMIALVQSASTLPLFLLGLPSGALADLLDRRRYLAWTHAWVAGVALALAALTFFGALNAPLLLLCSFLNGIGMAMRWPLFAAIVPQLVRRDDLPAALALNGIAGNMARIIGPLIAGALLAGAGSACVYLLNALLSCAALALILRWRPAPEASAPPPERFVAAMRAGLWHVLGRAQLRNILLRIFLFFLQATALMALLPLVALRLAGGGAGAGAFTTLLVAMGAGAVLAAFNLHRLRRLAGPDTLVGVGVCVHAAASAVAVLAPGMGLAAAALAVAGMAWIATANALTVAMQLALPDRVRARAMAIYQMAVMGGSAAGAALWGYVASVGSVRASVLAAAVLGPLVWWSTRRLGVGAAHGQA